MFIECIVYIFTQRVHNGPFVTNNRKFQVIPIMSIYNWIWSEFNWIEMENQRKRDCSVTVSTLYVSCFIYIYKDYWLGAFTLHVDYWDSALCFLQNKMTLTYSCSVFKNDFANKMNEVKTHLVRQAKYLVNTNSCI